MEVVLPRSNKSNSPFRYPGGKFYARKLILRHIPRHSYYCEPFAGGASIFFAKQKAKYSLLSDIDGDLVNTLIQIRDNVEDLIDMLCGIPATKELHCFYKNEYKPKTKLEQSFRWYYLNRTSYSGIMKPENCYWGFGQKYSMKPENWPAHLRTVSDKLSDVELKCCDFEELIDQLPDNCFIFVDPPYYNADQQKIYCHNFVQSDHKRLADCLFRNSARLKFLLTYDNSDYIKETYSWATEIQNEEWNYTINRTDDQRRGIKKKDGYKQQRYKGREILIKNYAIDFN